MIRASTERETVAFNGRYNQAGFLQFVGVAATRQQAFHLCTAASAPKLPPSCPKLAAE